ncbi:MAG: hypothetical protein PHW25_17505 [Zoogloea sp.]|uniref:hypothetical protein n=1 Tax=Zoogloea sp. TaxID=49181 RepID=UPI00260EEDA0|nr:hypothetical protein [Zoogloea sp.]MDD3328881.1 hypothetical protein [Zoogloea sp.]
MATIPKDVKDAVIARLDGTYGSASLVCDGYYIGLQVRRASAKSLRYVVCVFVDGVWRHRWSLADYQGPEQKFARRVEKYLHSEKDRKQMLKAAPLYGRKGSAERKTYEERINTKWVYFEPFFSNGRAAINHLLRVSENVAVPEEMLTT